LNSTSDFVSAERVKDIRGRKRDEDCKSKMKIGFLVAFLTKDEKTRCFAYFETFIHPSNQPSKQSAVQGFAANIPYLDSLLRT
jgi:hypothetical protein